MVLLSPYGGSCIAATAQVTLQQGRFAAHEQPTAFNAGLASRGSVWRGALSVLPTLMVLISIYTKH